MEYEQRMQNPQYQKTPERWIEAIILNWVYKLVYTVLTDAHLVAIKTALLKHDRESAYADGSVHSIDLPVDTLFSEDIYEYAQALCDDLPSIDTVRREVAKLKTQRPAYYKALIEGTDALHRDASPKCSHDVAEVDKIWTFDAVYPPIYIQHQEIMYRAVMIDMIDLFSDYRIHHLVFALKEIDSNDVIHHVDFKIQDVARFIATGMWEQKRRPQWLYSDRDGRFRHILENNYLPLLTTSGQETPIQMHLARKREPWTRGQKETGYWKEFHKFLRRYPGYYGPQNSRQRKPQTAIKNPSRLLTAEELEKNFAEFQASINRKPSPSERK